MDAHTGTIEIQYVLSHLSATKMKKFVMFYDKDKEVEWLNKMAQDGYAMTDFFAGLYTFEPCEKGEWQYQIDIGNGFFNVKKEYAEFMDEMGIEIVKCWGPWVVLRRKAAEGEFELFSDVDSRIAQYKKILIFQHVFALFSRTSYSPTGYLTSKPGRLGKYWSFGSFFVVRVGCCAEFVRKVRGFGRDRGGGCPVP